MAVMSKNENSNVFCCSGNRIQPRRRAKGEAKPRESAAASSMEREIKHVLYAWEKRERKENFQAISRTRWLMQGDPGGPRQS